MYKYSVKLQGADSTRTGMPGFLLRDLIDVLTEAAARALRLRVDGRGTARGTFPSWLDVAANFEVSVKNGAEVELTAPSLLEALPEKFQQQAFFSTLDVSKSCVGILEESLSDALAGDAESDLFDNAVLETYAEFERVLSRDIHSVTLTNGRPRPSGAITIQPQSIETINRLRRQTPAPRHVRVAGMLDTIRHSDRMFTLILESGATLRGVASGVEAERLAKHFGKTVVISGEAVFRPSGSLLRVEAEHIDIANAAENVSLWSVEPRPLEADLVPRSLIQHQGTFSGLNAIFGKWPGDETETELFTALEAIS